MTLHDFLALFEGVQAKRGYAMVRCPCHEDSKASLSVKEDGGKILINCHANCTTEQIVAALGISMSDLFTERREPVVSANREVIYTYVDADGSYLFEKVRGKDKEGNKTFFQRAKLSHGGFAPNLQHLNGKSKTLYRLPEVLAAVAKELPIYVMEGEKAVEAARAKGLVATCQPGGASKDQHRSKWLAIHTTWLTGAHVVIVADRDDIGEEYARYVASQLKAVSKSLRVVQSKTEGPKDDAWDHFKAGFTPEEFVARNDLAPRVGLAFTWFAEHTPREIDWVWEDRLPVGRAVILDGDGEMGKTTTCLAIAAGLSIGILPDGTPCKKRRTLVLASEDDVSDTLLPRFVRFGGDESMIAIYSEVFAFDIAGLKQLEETILDGRFGFVVADPITDYMPAGMNPNHATDVSAMLTPYNAMLMRTHCAAIDLRHTGKPSKEQQSQHAGLGSVHWRNKHRIQYVMEWSPTMPGLRVITQYKNNLAERVMPFGWSWRNGLFQWKWDIEGPARKGRPQDMRMEAKKFLRGLFAEYSVVLRDDVVARASALQIPYASLNRAREDLGIHSRRNSKIFNDDRYRWTVETLLDRFDSLGEGAE